MGRSQETYGKKEREKKKQRKKEAKAKRKEERKENPEQKGNEIAYMDAYGNFHDTPPEPPKKVKAEDIVLGVPKKEKSEDVGGVRQGVVSFFNTSKGYGFIKEKDSQNSIFVHINACTEDIVENNLVTFEVEESPKGPSAVNVKVVR